MWPPAGLSASATGRRVGGMHPEGRRKCRHCKAFFIPDPRNRFHQRYCGQPACRRASKAASQRKWESRPENRDYYCGSEKATKVRAWNQPTVLPEVLPAQTTPVEQDPVQDGRAVLPEFWHGQPPILIGFIAQMTGCVLPEDIAVVANRLIARGQALMGRPPEKNHDRKTSPLSGTRAAGAAAF
jgi:hypothetical protein